MSLTDLTIRAKLGRRPRPDEYMGLSAKACSDTARALIYASHASGVWVHVGEHLVELQRQAHFAAEWAAGRKVVQDPE